MTSAMCQARLSVRGLEIAKGAHERRVDPTLNRMPFEGEGRIMFAVRRDMRPSIAFVWFVRDHGSPIELADP
jgi:hypothetical protein